MSKKNKKDKTNKTGVRPSNDQLGENASEEIASQDYSNLSKSKNRK